MDIVAPVTALNSDSEEIVDNNGTEKDKHIACLSPSIEHEARTQKKRIPECWVDDIVDQQHEWQECEEKEDGTE